MLFSSLLLVILMGLAILNSEQSGPLIFYWQPTTMFKRKMRSAPSQAEVS